MAKRSSHKNNSTQANDKQHGCLHVIALCALWFVVTCFIMYELIPEELHGSSLFLPTWMLVFFLPVYIKPLCRLIGWLGKLIWKKYKTRKVSTPVEPVPIQHNVVADQKCKIEMQSASQLPSKPVDKNVTFDSAAYHRPVTYPSEPPKTYVPVVRPAESAKPYVDVLSDKDDKVQAELLSIDLMDGYQFEAWCADALKAKGFISVSVTQASNDQGVDILAEKDGVKYAFQCKRYSTDLGNTPIQEVHSGKDYYHRHVGVVITNQGFTTGAVSLAKETGTLLWGRKWIIDYLNQKYSTASPITGQSSIQAASCEPEHDEMFNAAVDVVLETNQASVSMIQRRLKLGYARAAHIVDEMEERGIVGPFCGSKPREILITQEQWRAGMNCGAKKQ